MNIVRKLKIDTVTSNAFTKEERELISFIENKISNLTIYKILERYETTDVIFYMNSDGISIFENIKSSKTLNVRRDNFWDILSDEYKLSDKEIIELISYLVPKSIKNIKFDTVEKGLNYPIIAEEHYENFLKKKTK